MPTSSPPPSPRAPGTALLVMSPGPGRRSARRALRAEGLRTQIVTDSYRATALFASAPTDVVVACLGGLRAAAPAFVRALRRRSRDAILVVVVPADLRRTAVRALGAGADAYVLEPWYPEELQAVVGGLTRQRASALSRTATSDALPRLAEEVAHAVNNPLQVLTLQAEAGALPPASAAVLRTEIRRIREVVDRLEAFARTGALRAVPARLGPLLDRAIDEARDANRIEIVSRHEKDGPLVLVDGDQTSAALASMLLLLTARSTDDVPRVAARVLEGRGPAGRYVQAALRAESLHISSDDIRTLRSSVFVTDDRTRRTYPGLAVPEAVARRHGGRLVARETPRGTLLAIRLPVANGEDLSDPRDRSR